MAVSDQLTFMVVTYNKDFDMLDRLVGSIVEHFSTTYPLLVILNDSAEYLEELDSILKKYPLTYSIRHDFEELHRPIEPDCHFGTRGTDDGWIVQQMLTLLAARAVETTYYLHLCSKDMFVDKFELEDIVVQGKTRVLQETFNHTQKWMFETFYQNSCKLFDLDPAQHRNQYIRCETPMLVKTQRVREMLDSVESMGYHIIDVIGIDEERKQCQKS